MVDQQASLRAANLAARAEEAADRLKPGTWEAVQALATLSIAESLVAAQKSNGPS
jgi:hypothetical protein